jgi:hypothetical protein
MTGSEQSSWSIVSVPSPDLARTASGAAPVEHSDWVRLFMGASFARCRMGSGSGAVAEYLVSGLRLSDAGPLDDSTSAEVAAALGQAFDGLRDVLAFHRKRIDEAQRRAERGGDVPYELLLTTYPMLMCVTVSDDPDDWVVTDEGLCIVRWGLRSPRMRPLLQWTDAELQAMRASVFLQSRLRLVEPGSGSTPANEVVRGSWYAVGAAESPQPASGAPKQQAAGASGRPVVAKSTAGVTIAVRSRPRSKALDWAFRVAVVGLAVVVGLLCGRAMSPSSKGPSQQEQQRSSGSLPMAAQQSSGSLESVPAAQPAGATASSREVEDLRKQTAEAEAARRVAEEKLNTAKEELNTAKEELKTAGEKLKTAEEKVKGQVDPEAAQREAKKLEGQIKDFERKKRLESKATQLAVALEYWPVDGKLLETLSKEDRLDVDHTRRAMKDLERQTTAAIDQPISQRWREALKGPLDYTAIQITQPPGFVNVPPGFYWCPVDDLNSAQAVGWPKKLFNNIGEHPVNPQGSPPKFEQRSELSLGKDLARLPELDSKSTVRILWEWMLDLDKRLIPAANGAKPASNAISIATESGKLNLPPVLAEPLVSKVLDSLNSALEELSKLKPSPSGLNESRRQLKEARDAWAKHQKPSQSTETFHVKWKKVKDHLSAWSSGARIDNAITLFGVWDGQTKEGSPFVCPTFGVVAAGARRGTLFAVVGGEPKKIGDVIDGMPNVAQNAPRDLPDGCPVIFVSTSPGAKGSAAEVPSK